MTSKCDEFSMWHTQLSLARAILMVLALILMIFTTNYPLAALFIAGSMVLAMISSHLEAKHAQWHIDHADDDSDNKINYNYKPYEKQSWSL